MGARAATKLTPFLFLCLLIWSFFATLHFHALPLPQSEVDALKRIGVKLRKQWNFNVDPDPCSGNSVWVDPNSTYVAVNVTCGACNETNCHIISIQLKSQNLSGVLPDEFSNLTHLQVIDLSRNYLSGTIPVSWASLPLTNLSLLGNRISGTIPEKLKGITTLQELVLEDNLMQGPIPQSLGNLINLNKLHLSGNNFSGELPKSLGNLTNITDFRIDGNPISGKIPAFIGNWKKLEKLYMVGTSLEGPFPSNFSALEALTELMVSPLIGGDGKFPPLQNMIKMHRLILRNISLSGELPDLQSMKNLKILDLSFNNLTGKIPDTFRSLIKNKLNYLFLTNNKLTGEIPGWIWNNYQNYDLSYNNFDSPPSDQCYYTRVNLVSSYSTSNNNTIPPCFRKNHPCSRRAENYELFINCGGPQLSIRESVYQEDIESQGSSYYQAYGEKWAFSSTGYFVGNEKEPYIATTPTEVLNTTNQKLFKNARLSPLSLKYYGLCLQNGNYTVVLHFAEIMFTDDQTYFSVGRRIFDVSIQGKKFLQDFDIAKEANGTGRAINRSYIANVTNNTLEIHFQWSGKGTTAIPHRSVYGPLISAIAVTPFDFTPVIYGKSKKLSVGVILGIVVGACVLIALISIFIWSFWRRKNDENSELRGLELQTGYFTLRQIKAATGNLNPANKIGEGGFGPVYKGVLPDGSLIAVKQLSSKSRQGNREFVNEIGMISALNHPNLVKLFGCCIEGNQLLLVYEYMENNSLASVLFGPERDRAKLDWQTRRRICLCIARGLAYLHEESRLKIVHRDIKATNVLLDKDLNAKISDFGLARLSGETESHISTRIAGTIGYMAPEYAMRGYLTDKADVYSFGVVMLEIICGLSNTHVYKMEEESMYLLDWALILQGQGELLDMVDKNLGENYPKEEALDMLNLALTCTNSSPSLRPTMSTVVSILDGKSTLSTSYMKPVASSSDVPSFQVFEKCFDDSQSADASIDTPWLDSSVSQQSSQDENTRQTSKLLSDFSTSSFDVKTQRRYPKRNLTATF